MTNEVENPDPEHRHPQRSVHLVETVLCFDGAREHVPSPHRCAREYFFPHTTASMTERGLPPRPEVHPQIVKTQREGCRSKSPTPDRSDQVSHRSDKRSEPFTSTPMGLVPRIEKETVLMGPPSAPPTTRDPTDRSSMDVMNGVIVGGMSGNAMTTQARLAEPSDACGVAAGHAWA